MKFVMVLALLLAFGAQASVDLKLNDKKMNLGELTQARGMRLQETLMLTRTAATPAKVKVKFSHKYKGLVCMRWVMRGNPFPDHYPRYSDYDRYRSYERYCMRYAEKVLTVQKSIKLNFKDAAMLSKVEVETFEITIDQERFKRADLDYEAKVISSKHDYKVKSRGRRFEFDLK